MAASPLRPALRASVSPPGSCFYFCPSAPPLRRCSAGPSPPLSRLFLSRLGRPAFSTSCMQSAAGAAPYRSAPQRTWFPKHPGGYRNSITKREQLMKRSLVKVKRPAVGERKRFRHRVQLSNDSALPGRSAGPLQPKTLLSPTAAGQVYGLPEDMIEALRELRTFRPTQSWSLFRSPHTLVRRETVGLISHLQPAFDARATATVIVHGGPGTGKSVLALQAITHAKLNNCVVINIPSAQDLVLNHSSYAPIPNTNPMQFIQPEYTKKLLDSIANGNHALLDKYKTTREYRFDTARLPARSPLSAIAFAVGEPESAWAAFMALWKELTIVPDRPPLLFVLEGLEHLMGLSQYRDPAFQPVHAFELALPRIFLSALAPRPLAPKEPTPTFINGAAFLATSGGSSAPRVPAYAFAIAQAFAAAAQAPIPTLDAYVPAVHDPRVRSAVCGVDVLRLGPVSRDEARAVMDYWASGGVMRAAVTEATVARQCAISGGVMNDLVHSTLMTVRS